MKRSIPSLFLAFFLGLTSISSAWALAPGEAAPDFSVTDSQGKKQSLSQYKGKVVVLEWFNEGCPYVKKHYNSKNMQQLQKELTAKGVVWLTVLSSAPGKQGHATGEQINAIMKQWEGAPTANLLDPEGKVGQLYGAKTTPHIYVIDASGKLVYMGAIDDQASSDPATINGAKNYLRPAVEEILAGKPVTTPSTTPYGCSVKYAG